MKTNPPLRAAVIGAGAISEEHLRFLAARDGVELVGVCDLSPALVEYTSDRYCPGRGFTDHAKMLADASPDVVHVLTPCHTHEALVQDALSAGAHVLCEKPITPDRDTYLRLWRFAEERGLHLMESQNYRFNRPVQRVLELVESGEIGDVVEVEVRLAMNLRSMRYGDRNLPHPSHRLPAGAIHEFITHLSYLLLMFCPDVQRVRATWRNLDGGDLFKYDDMDASVFGEKTVGRIRVSCDTGPDAFFLTVRGTDGWAEAEFYQPHVRAVRRRSAAGPFGGVIDQCANGASMMRSSISNLYNKIAKPKRTYEGLHIMLEQAYDALVNGSPLPIGFGEIDGALRLIEALVEDGKAA